MRPYQRMIKKVLNQGKRKSNRTGVDTLSVTNHHYQVNLQAGYPLLTTKDMSGSIWNSITHEFVWYLSGDHHIRELREETSIWDNWANQHGELETAYGRFWRRYPVPSKSSHLPGEAWADEDCPYTQEEDGELVLDQIAYLRDTIHNNPNSRRMVLTAWHPGNACVSGLPPCHFTATFNVTPDGLLDCHLTQRSGDLGLGIPFNIAHYALLTYVLAQDAGLRPGSFSHTINDLHIYIGDGSKDNPQNHIPQLVEQYGREPKELPRIKIADKDLDELQPDDFELKNYNPHPRLKMKVAV